MAFEIYFQVAALLHTLQLLTLCPSADLRSLLPKLWQHAKKLAQLTAAVLNLTLTQTQRPISDASFTLPVVQGKQPCWSLSM